VIFSRGCPIGPEDIAQAQGRTDTATRNGDESSPQDALRHWLQRALTTEGEANLFDACMDRFASLLIREALNLSGGNRSRAAKLLGLSRPTLLAKIDKYRIKMETSALSDLP
jgi:DNA-binding protein Fis